MVENGKTISAALNQRIDEVESTTEAARAATEQRLGAEIEDSAAQVRTAVMAEVDATKARVSDVETAVVRHGENIAGLAETTEALTDAEGANTAFRQQMAASYGANVPQGIANEIDGQVSAVSAAFEQRIDTEASAREARLPRYPRWRPAPRRRSSRTRSPPRPLAASRFRPFGSRPCRPART